MPYTALQLRYLTCLVACFGAGAGYAAITVVSQQADASIETENTSVVSDFSATVGSVDLHAVLDGSQADTTLDYTMPAANQRQISGSLSPYARADNLGEQRSVTTYVELMFELDRASEFTLFVDPIDEGGFLFSLAGAEPGGPINFFTDADSIQAQGVLPAGLYALNAQAFAFAENVGDPGSDSVQVAFALTITTVPTPAGFAPIATVLVGLGLTRRRTE